MVPIQICLQQRSHDLHLIPAIRSARNWKSKSAGLPSAEM
jgi:hypothetical protein